MSEGSRREWRVFPFPLAIDGNQSGITNMRTRIPFDAGMRCSRRGFLQGAAGVTVSAWMTRDVLAQANRPDPLTPAKVDKQLIVHQQSPYNAEPALDDLIGAWVTPVEHFFVRSHAPQVPDIDPAAFRVSVEGMVQRPLKLSLRQLQEFPQSSVTATLTCAGNRRSDYNAIRGVSGVQWQEGAIGNAQWG
jgi:sulfite oxidase